MRLRPSGKASLLGIAVVAVGYTAIALSVTNSYYQSVLALVPVWAVLALAWNILSGYGGLISFCHAAFFGIGAYVVALGAERFGIPTYAGLILAGLAGAAAGLLIGSITLRLRGHFRRSSCRCRASRLCCRCMRTTRRSKPASPSVS